MTESDESLVIFTTKKTIWFVTISDILTQKSYHKVKRYKEILKTHFIRMEDL